MIKRITTILGILGGGFLAAFLLGMLGAGLGLDGPVWNIARYLLGFGLAALIYALWSFSSRLKTQRPGLESIGEEGKIAWLLYQGTTPRSGHPLGRDSTMVGRDPRQCQVFINNDTISRRHAQIMRVAEGYLLRDLGSRNGTMVNGIRIEERYLEDGDQVTFGDVQFLFQGPKAGLPPPPSEATSVVSTILPLEDTAALPSDGLAARGTASRASGSWESSTGTRTGSGSRLRPAPPPTGTRPTGTSTTGTGTRSTGSRLRPAPPDNLGGPAAGEEPPTGTGTGTGSRIRPR